MAHFELANGDTSADALYELAMTHASGRSAPADLVSAHKWFNIAAMKGHVEAAQLRRELVTIGVVGDTATDLQGLQVVGVVVAGREHIGADHDAAADFRAKASRAGLFVHVDDVASLDTQAVPLSTASIAPIMVRR